MKSLSTGENGTEGARNHQIRSKWSRTLRGKIILELSNLLMQWETEEKKKADEMQICQNKFPYGKNDAAPPFSMWQ